MGGNFCEYAKEGHDDYKSLLMAYSDASAKYGVCLLYTSDAADE